MNREPEFLSLEQLAELGLTPADAYRAGVVDRIAADGSPYWIREELESAGLVTGDDS